MVDTIRNSDRPFPSLFMMVDPGWRRRGIATALMTEAIKRWPGLDLRKQSYTRDGERFINSFLKRMAAEDEELDRLDRLDDLLDIPRFGPPDEQWEEEP